MTHKIDDFPILKILGGDILSFNIKILISDNKADILEIKLSTGYPQKILFAFV